MKEKIKLVLGIIWALPVTLALFLFYIIPMWVLGLYQYAGWDEMAWVWHFDLYRDASPIRLKFRKLWAGWAGFGMGNIAVVKVSDAIKGSRYLQMTLAHEKEHVRQSMRLGPLFPVIYGLVWLMMKVALRNCSAYLDGPFEIDARRAAGQMVDIYGATKNTTKRK